ncbi:MAG: rRNA maturation RNase YbeY [Brevinematales bacterium]|jgi:probable rRNA maturation factor
MIHVIYNDGKVYESVLTDCLSEFLDEILSDFKKGGFEVNLVLCSDRYIHTINKQYRNKDCPTDVLSFSMQEDEGEDFFEAGSEDMDGFEEPEILGDIIISTERSEKQAVEYGVTAEEELARLAIHGMLHLLGFDHEKSDEDEKIMFEEQDKYLDKFLQSYSH